MVHAGPRTDNVYVAGRTLYKSTRILEYILNPRRISDVSRIISHVSSDATDVHYKIYFPCPVAYI